MAPTDLRKQSLFDESDDDSDGGAQLNINQEYAKRFEHNKKREELHRLEEKYKSKQPKDDDHDSDSSSDAAEDDNGFLATEELDAQISATLQAIKNKDPRVYDGKTTFYAPIDENADSTSTVSKQKTEKPIYLQDYHREKLLRGDTGVGDDEEEPPATYAQEQHHLKKSIQDEIQAQLRAGDNDEESDNDEDFLKAKEETRVIPNNGIHPSRARKVKHPKPNIAEADKDPENFLSNFMASRAWVEEDGNRWQAFESDEGEDNNDKADEWETAYNLRFEDPSKSNEVLKSYARDVTAARSVRREDKSGRQAQREKERQIKEEEKEQRRKERKRLRDHKIEEAENKLKKIKKAAGLSGKALKDDEWQRFLEDAWENDKWEEEMNKTFNEQYYAAADEEFEGGSETANGSKKGKKVKKPTFDDDIDIKDLVPDFEDEERPKVDLADEDDEAEAEEADDDDDDAPTAKRQKTTKERKKERLVSQQEAKRERAKLEALVTARMEIEEPEILTGSSARGNKGQGGFAYRETKPESFGLTTRDILMASDADLNTYAGLKKLAHFRDPEKQSKDRKNLGKKARLRQWRKETFGPEFEREPPAFNPGGPDDSMADAGAADASNIVEGGSKKKRKRSRGKKGKEAAVEA